MKVGIVGLGLMGTGFAKNLIRKEYEVFGYDTVKEKRDALRLLGGVPCESLGELAEKADVVLILVFNADNVRSVIFGNDEEFPKHLAEGKTVMFACSCGAEVVREVAPALQNRGIRVLDTPLMGDCFDAEDGSIRMILAAKAGDYENLEGLFSDIAGDTFRVSSEIGKGQEAKSCLQALFSLTFEMGFEITNLVKATGLDIEEMRRMFRQSPSSSMLFHISEDKVLSETYTGTKNPLSILDKDITIALGLAKEYGLKLNACEGTKKTFDEAMERYPKEDIWAASKVVANHNEELVSTEVFK